ncbi:hypothetical protein TNCV_1298381 [Trichonephila clavipes]|nr:hypothetical protein TNCV_1298381 [Trichonephila clavipes]
MHASEFRIQKPFCGQSQTRNSGLTRRRCYLFFPKPSGWQSFGEKSQVRVVQTLVVESPRVIASKKMDNGAVAAEMDGVEETARQNKKRIVLTMKITIQVRSH